METIILNLIEQNKHISCDEFIDSLRLSLVGKVGLVKANNIINQASDLIITKYQEIELEKAEARAERRSHDKVMSRVMSYWDYAKQQREN